MNVTRDFVGPGLHLQRNVREALHDLVARAARRRGRSAQVFLAADVSAQLLVAVDQHDERVPRLERRADRAPTPRSVMVNRYSPSAGNVCVAFMPPRVPSGIPATCPLGRSSASERTRSRPWPSARRPRVGDRARGVDILLDERRRDAERRRDVRRSRSPRSRAASIPPVDSTSSKSFTALAYSFRLSRCAGT